MGTVAAIGSVLGAVGSIQSGQAAGRAAQAQERAANQGLQQSQAQRDLAIQDASSPQELAELERAQQFQGRSLERQEKLIQGLSPAILEAATQANQLLKGEEAKSLAPLRQANSRKRQALLNSLREQLGPGAETSSIGQQALQNFDMQASEQLFGAQQSSLQQLFGLGAHQDTREQGVLNQQFGLSDRFGARGARIGNARLGFEQQVGAARGRVSDSAGSQFVGQQLQGSALGALGGQLAQGGLGLIQARETTAANNKASDQRLQTQLNFQRDNNL